MRTYKNITIDSLSAGLNDILSNHASPESNPEDRINVDQWNSYCSSQSSKAPVNFTNYLHIFHVTCLNDLKQ